MNVFLLAATISVLAAGASTQASGLKVDDLVVAHTSRRSDTDATIKAAKGFYEFWDTGDREMLNRSISPDFTDHTLPPGRPQGPGGPAFASDNFRKAVPDLRVEVVKMVVAGDYVTTHMVFTGHFSGSFGDRHGDGRAIRFMATDLIRVRTGRVTDNWHIEDNLTFLQQVGLAPR